MILRRDNIKRLVELVTSTGGVFVAPVVDTRQVVYRAIGSGEEIELNYILPRNSFKEFLFPQTEVIARFSMNKGGVDLENMDITPPDTVIFGARPCDTASLPSMRAVFTWDYIDEFYTRREERITVISIGCTQGDDDCFCTTVGLSPESRKGADIYLLETEQGDFVVESVTDRGRDFIQRYEEVFEQRGDVKTKALFMPERIDGIDVERIKGWLSKKENYQSPLWAELARKCIGCGACTFTCPTCHCFDIMDEAGLLEGERRKNWDSCQFDFFTLHASGHNPRDTQFKRWRNRFMCKFNFYPNKFSSRGCVGCGRCIRVCPVRLDITEVMEGISKEQ